MPKPESAAITHITVPVNAETVEILDRTTNRDGVSLAEAVYQLVGVGDIITTMAKVDGVQILAKYPDDDRLKKIDVL